MASRINIPQTALLGDISDEDAAKPVSGWSRFAAALQDIGSDLGSGTGGNLDALYATKRAQQQAVAQRTQAVAAAKQLFPDNQQLQLMAGAKPDVFWSTVGEAFKPTVVSAGSTLHGGVGGDYTAPSVEKPTKPQIVNVGNGHVLAVNPDDLSNPQEIYTAPPSAPSAPPGFAMNPDGSMHFIQGGPADPRFAGTLAGAKRAPPKAPAGLGNGGFPGLPPGYRPR